MGDSESMKIKEGSTCQQAYRICSCGVEFGEASPHFMKSLTLLCVCAFANLCVYVCVYVCMLGCVFVTVYACLCACVVSLCNSDINYSLANFSHCAD